MEVSDTPGSAEAAPVADAGDATGAGEPRADSVDRDLAQANLHRMRGQWQDAESRCIGVMRADPNNVHAHSLLGDIYRDQGRFDDAAQWYRLALDLDPESAADRAKLAQVEQEIARLAARNPVPDSEPSEPLTPGVGTQKLLGLPPATWVNGATAAAVIFIVLIVGIVLFRPQGAAREPRDGTISGTIRRTATSPGPPLPARGAAVAPEASATSPGEAGSQAPEASPEPSSREQTLQLFLSRQPILQSMAAVGPVTVDGRSQRAAIVLTYEGTAATPEALRADVLRVALAAAQGAFSVDSGLQRITLSVRQSGEGTTPEALFAGETSRAALQAVGPNPTEDEVAAAFGSIWWAQSLSPSGAVGPQTQENGIDQ